MKELSNAFSNIIAIFLFSILLTSCAQSSNSAQEYSNCPTIELSQINSSPENPDYFDQTAKLVEKETQSLVGLTEENVEYCAVLNNLDYRVGARDGEFFALTLDYIPTRITVEIEKKIVVKIQVG
jgi:hypothetical protein